MTILYKRTCIVAVQKVGESLRGEMTVVEPHQKLVHFSLIDTLAETMRISSAEVRGFLLFYPFCCREKCLTGK